MNKLDPSHVAKLIVPISHRAMLYKLVYEVTKLLDKHDIPYFMDGGTLLGAIRHTDLIPWDDDIDLGVLDKDFYRKLPKLKCEFEKFGFFVDNKDSHLMKVYIKDRWLVDEFKTVGTPTLDIFCYTVKKGKIRLHKQSHYIRWKAATYDYNDMFPLKEYKFGPIKLKGANNPFPYLDGLYKDWQDAAVIEMRSMNPDGTSNKGIMIKVKIHDLFDFLDKHQILGIVKEVVDR